MTRYFLLPLLILGSATAAQPTLQSDDSRAADQVLKRGLSSPKQSESKHPSWLVRIAALKRSRPDSAGLSLATRYLSDPALVVRLQAVHWIQAFSQAQGAGSIPLATLHALRAQLHDSRNFRASGEPIWVPGASLALLTLATREADVKKAREWKVLLQSLAQKSRSSAWKAQLQTSLRSLP